MLDKFLSIIEKIIPKKYRWILNHEGFKRYFLNTGWMFGGQLFFLLVSFFIGAWVARYLGPENYGVLNYATAFVGLFTFLSDFGAGAILTRELVKFPEKRDRLMGTVFRMKLAGGTLALILATIATFAVGANPLTRLLVIIFAVSLILQSMNVISLYFQSQVKSKNNVRAMTFATCVSSLLKITAVLTGQGVTAIITIYALDVVWQGIGFIYSYRRAGLNISHWVFDWSLAKEIWRSSWPLMLSAAASYIFLRIDQVMIGTMMGKREVGFYAAAVKLVEIWYFIPGIICSSLFPAIINARNLGTKIYHQRLRNFYILMTVIPLLISAPIVLLSKPLIYWLFGASYLPAVGVLRIYIWSSLGLFLGTAVYQHLMAEDRARIMFVVNIIAMATNVGLNLFFIPTFGLTGAALATLISYCIMPIGAWLAESKWFRSRAKSI